MFDGFASVIREFAFVSMWLSKWFSMVRMPCRVLHSTSTNLLSYVRLWVVLQTDSYVRLGNISTDEELWVDLHKMIGILAPLLRSFVFVFLVAVADEHMVVAGVCLYWHRRQHGWTCTQPRFAELRWEIDSHGFV